MAVHDALRHKLAGALAANGVSADPNVDGLHSWRCSHYRHVKGPCRCLEELLDDLVAVVEEITDGGTDEG